MSAVPAVAVFRCDVVCTICIIVNVLFGSTYAVCFLTAFFCHFIFRMIIMSCAVFTIPRSVVIVTCGSDVDLRM